MKKLALLLAVCLITWSLAGCQTQPAPSSGETSASAGSVSSGGQPESSLPESDPVVVCVNYDFEQDMEELLDYLSAIAWRQSTSCWSFPPAPKTGRRS